MMDPIPPADLAGEPPGPTPPRAPRVRWQVAVLIVGAALIVSAGLFMLWPRTPVEESPPTAQPITFVEGKTYTEAIVGQPALVNPLLATSQADRDLVALVYSGLTRLDIYGQPIPDLATGWEVSDDGLTYIFTLREGVQWHDGEPFTAEDVAFTMSLLRDPAFDAPGDLAAFWRTVETYAVDDHTVRFVLTQPLSAFPEIAGIGIVPRHLLGGIAPEEIHEDSFNLAPIGTGRMRWDSSYVDEDETVAVRLVPFDDYYDPARAVGFEEVILRFYADPADAFAALGPDAQALGGLTPAELDAALASSRLNLYSATLPAYKAIIFNQGEPERLPFFQEQTVRQALTAALNRPAILADALPGGGVPAVSPIPPGVWAHSSAVQPIPYDPAAATALLDEAGWQQGGNTRAKDGTRLRFTLLVADREADERIAEAAVDAWAAVGVDAEVEVVEPAELLERLGASEDGDRDYDAALVEFGQGRLADPDPYPFWHDSQIEGGQNYSALADRDISEALEIARKDPNGVRRAELYDAFQRWFVERAAAILLYHPVYHYALSCQVQGVQIKILVDPSDRFNTLHEWHIVAPTEGDACPAESAAEGGG